MTTPADRLANGDIIGFVIECFVYMLQEPEILYALLTLVGTVTLYNRTESIFPCLVLWFLVGSALIVMMPVVSLFAVFLTIVGGAGILAKVFANMR